MHRVKYSGRGVHAACHKEKNPSSRSSRLVIPRNRSSVLMQITHKKVAHRLPPPQCHRFLPLFFTSVSHPHISMVILDHGFAMLYRWQKCDQGAAIFLPEEPVSTTSLRAHLLILKMLLIRRDLRNLLIKHAVQHHNCMPANNSSITNRYQFILNCVFLRDYALPVTLTFDVRMNNGLRAAMITWFQQLPAIVVTLFPRDPLITIQVYIYISGPTTYIDMH